MESDAHIPKDIMDQIISDQYRERTFLRSCLESAPAKIMPGRRPALGLKGLYRPGLQLHQLKQDLLHAALAQTNDLGICKQLCRAANEAADLAWETTQPMLVFPCLFEEMAGAVWPRRQQNEFEEDGDRLAAYREFEPAFPKVHPDFPPSNPIPSAETDLVLLILSGSIEPASQTI